MRTGFFAFALGFIEALRKLAIGTLAEAFGYERWHRVRRGRQLVEQTTILLKARTLDDLGHFSGRRDRFLINHQVLHAGCLHDDRKGTRHASGLPTDYRRTTD